MRTSYLLALLKEIYDICYEMFFQLQETATDQLIMSSIFLNV